MNMVKDKFNTIWIWLLNNNVYAYSNHNQTYPNRRTLKMVDINLLHIIIFRSLTINWSLIRLFLIAVSYWDVADVKIMLQLIQNQMAILFYRFVSQDRAPVVSTRMAGILDRSPMNVSRATFPDPVERLDERWRTEYVLLRLHYGQRRISFE